MRIVTALLLPFILTLNASAGPIQSLAFRFANDGGAAYQYVSGDIEFAATAELAGHLVLEYDVVSGDASISQIEGRLHSPKQTAGWIQAGTHWLDGAALEAEVPGLFDGMTGVRTGPLEFAFSSKASPHRSFTYRTEFLLSIDPTDYRLSGKAEFNGNDGPSMYFDAPLVAVPEPSCLALATFAVAAALVRGRRSAKR